MLYLDVEASRDVGEEGNDVFRLSGSSDAGDPFDGGRCAFRAPEFPVEQPGDALGGDGVGVDGKESCRMVPGPS